jgi:hypothetical protein
MLVVMTIGSNHSAQRLSDVVLRRFTLIMNLFLRALAADAYASRLVAPLRAQAWNRVHRIACRFTARLRRRIHPSAVSMKPPRPPARCANPSPRANPFPRASRAHGWLRRAAPGSAFACACAKLQTLLRDPDCQTLLAQDPCLAAIIRPLCHMAHLSLAPAPPPPTGPITLKPIPPDPGPDPRYMLPIRLSLFIAATRS